MLDFILAALPWLVLGICTVIIIAKVSKNKKAKKENSVKLSDTRVQQEKKEEKKEISSTTLINTKTPFTTVVPVIVIT